MESESKRPQGRPGSGRGRHAALWFGLPLLVAIGVLAIRPVSGEYRVWQARRALADRDPAKAIRWLERAEQIAPGRSRTAWLMA